MNEKLIFAKATVESFCAIVAYVQDSELIVCDIVTSENISKFLTDISELTTKHNPILVQYECSIYLNECRNLREILSSSDTKVRGYKSEGAYLDRIVSQANFISESVVVDESLSEFTAQILSFKPSDKDKSNIALDVLSDAAKFMRRRYFE